MSQTDRIYHNFRIAVPADYKNVFSHFYFAENKSDYNIKRILFPSYQTILIFNFGTKAVLYSKANTKIEIDKCVVIGTIRKAFEYALPPQSKILVINFKDDAFYRFFGNASLTENLPFNPDEILSQNCFTVLWAKLSKIEDVYQQVNCILTFCNPFLKHRDKIAEQLANFSEKSLNPIQTIASNNNQTVRNIQIKQKEYFGYTAKEIIRYKRFLKAVKYLEKMDPKASRVDWFNIINECGYYDQSQLIKDFKLYLDTSPTKYLKCQQDMCNPVK